MCALALPFLSLPVTTDHVPNVLNILRCSISMLQAGIRVPQVSRQATPLGARISQERKEKGQGANDRPAAVPEEAASRFQ